MDTESFLAAAGELLAVPSTADRPGELGRALDFVLDFVGPGLHGGAVRLGRQAERAALPRAGRGRSSGSSSTRTWTWSRPRPGSSSRGCEGDRLYARGAQDMKVSALVQAQVFRELAGAACRTRSGLQLVTDEEVGGRDGTLHQLEQGVQRRVRGHRRAQRAAHRDRLQGHDHGQPAGRRPRRPQRLPVAGRQRPGQAAAQPGPAAGRLPGRRPRRSWRTTVNVARIETPNQARNQIPEQAEAWLDIRYPPEDPDLDGKTIPELTAYLATFCEPGVTPVVEPGRPAAPRRPGPAGGRGAAAGRAQPGLPRGFPAQARRRGRRGSTTSGASTRSSSASAATACTAPASTPRSPRSRRTTGRWPSSCATRRRQSPS